MAKLPGLSTDLTLHYTRSVGTVLGFQGSWNDWMVLPRAARVGPVEFPGATLYHETASGGISDDRADDLTCVFRCGRGAFPLHLPRFVAALQDEAAAERGAFVFGNPERDWPQGTLSVWEEALSYARAHRGDPRVPELLYRLIRVDRWGAASDRLGQRAFRLLHARYPGSAWAKRSPYYYN